STAIDAVRDLLASAKERAKILKTESEEATRLEHIWNDLLRFVSQAWFFHILALVDKETAVFKRLRDEDHPAVPALDEVYRRAKDQADTIQRRYPGYLENACRAANLALDAESRHPRYTFNQGFLRVEIDDQRRVASLSDHEGRLGELPAD